MGCDVRLFDLLQVLLVVAFMLPPHMVTRGSYVVESRTVCPLDRHVIRKCALFIIVELQTSKQS